MRPKKHAGRIQKASRPCTLGAEATNSSLSDEGVLTPGWETEEIQVIHEVGTVVTHLLWIVVHGRAYTKATGALSKSCVSRFPYPRSKAPRASRS